MQSVAVTGASGFVGQSLVLRLLERGFRVVALSRDPQALAFPAAVERRTFDPGGPPNAGAFAGVDAIVHLAGESVAGRWTAAKKRAIYDSRVAGTQRVVQSLGACEKRPGVLLCASASGYYGDRGDEALTEDSAAGSDFLAAVCADWERAAMAAEKLGVRAACLRTGIVLGSRGALDNMRAPFTLGLGGPFGGGRQFVPWIHIDDLVRMYVFALETPGIRGPLNAVAPDYSTSARFAQALGAALRRPALLPAPAPALRAVLGEFAGTLLGSQLMIPAAAQDAGFTWMHAQLEDAIAGILSPNSAPRSPVRRFAREQTINAPIHKVFEFFCDPRNLEEITPAFLQFQIQTAPAALARGSMIEYRLRLRGLRLAWKTLIAQWKPPHAFTDEQLHGPYALWRHTHTFEPLGSATKMSDEVVYALPYAPLSSPLTPSVERDIAAIFDFRGDRIAQRLCTNRR